MSMMNRINAGVGYSDSNDGLALFSIVNYMTKSYLYYETGSVDH